MRIKIENTKTEIKYILKKVPQKYYEAIQHYFFQLNGDIFTKTYIKNQFMFSHDIRIIEQRFSMFLADMLEVTIGHKIMDWELALENIIKIMDEHKINWWLTGSAACAVRGIRIIPRDIDIMTYKTEISKIEKAYENYIVEPFHHVTDWLLKGFGVVFLNGRIDFAFEPEENSDADEKFDFGFYASKNLETIMWRGNQVKVPPVELHVKSNENRKREDRVKMIMEYIKYRK